MVSVASQDGMTALIHATRFGNTETVKTLLAAGADVNLQEKVKKQVLLQKIVFSYSIVKCKMFCLL